MAIHFYSQQSSVSETLDVYQADLSDRSTNATEDLHPIQHDVKGTDNKGENDAKALKNSSKLFADETPQVATTTPSKIRLEEMAVILVDANYPEGPFEQDTNLNGNWNLEEEKGNMIEVLKQANKLNVPVFEIYLYSDTDKSLLAFKGKNWTTIKKPEMSAFYKTTLHDELKRRKIKHLILMGRNQSACVMKSAHDALNLGYEIHTSMDVIQDTASSVFKGEDCEVTKDGISEVIPCRSLVVKPKNETIFSYVKPKHKKLPRGVTVRPMNTFKSSVIDYYRKNGNLAPTYLDLPIFGHKERNH